mgnify:FL=1
MGFAVSLHLHPAIAGEPLLSVEEFTVVAGKGIKGNGEGRMFNQNNRRQVSMIEREQLVKHAESLRHPGFAPGEVRSNIETKGLNLIKLIGQNIRIGAAELRIYQPRTPCHKMDLLVPGLRKRMMDGQQGIMAEVVQSGIIRAGDYIAPLP